MSIRDNRRPAFSWQSQEAMRRLREFTPARSLSSVRSVYLAFCELACEQRDHDHEGTIATRQELADAAGVSIRTVDGAVALLEEACLVSVVKRVDERGRSLPSTYGLESGETTVSRGATIAPRGAGKGLEVAPLARGGDVQLPDREGETTSLQDVNRVFGEWLKATGRDPKRWTLTPKRRSQIKAALKHPLGVDGCIAAVRNIGADAWAAGQNDRNRPFNDIEHALGTPERLERWANQTQRTSNVHQLPERRLANSGDFRRFDAV